MDTTNEKDLLNYIRQNTEMGIDGIDMIFDHVKSEEFRSVLSKQKSEYKKYYSDADSLLRKKGGEPEEISAIAKVSTTVMGKMKNLTDREDSDYAEDMIKGTSMGISKLIKHIHNYCGESNSDALSLGEKLLDTEEANLEDIKRFL